MNLISILAKIAIIIPLAIIVTALMIKFNTPSKSDFLPPYSEIKTSITPVITLVPLEVASTSGRLDLTGPYVCSFTNKEGSFSAYIKNQQVFIKLIQGKTEQKFLLKDGCYYLWNNSQAQGEKRCGGIDKLFSLVNQLLGMSLMGINFNFLSSQLQSLFSSCQKIDFSHEIFNLPAGVSFLQK